MTRDELHIAGPATTAEFHRAVLDEKDFLDGRITTRWVEDVFLSKRKAAAKQARTA